VIFVGHRHPVVEKVLEQRHREVARDLDPDPVRDRVALEPRLDPDELDLRAKGSQGSCDADRQPAATDRDQDRVDVRHLFGELEPDRPLTGDDELVFVRVDERAARLLHMLLRRNEGILEIGAGHDGLRAVVLARLDLRHRRVLRDVDGRGRTELAGRPRDRLAVIARARGDDARRALVRRQRRQLVDRAAHLERACALQVLRLQQHLAAHAPRERLREVDRRLFGDAGEPLPRLFDVSECWCRP
jgi:hypothetical protein